MTLELAHSGIENTWANFGLKSRQSQFPNLDWCLQGILVHTIPKTERLDKIARRDFFLQLHSSGITTVPRQNGASQMPEEVLTSQTCV